MDLGAKEKFGWKRMKISLKYIAGFFDGEGCIVARPKNGKSIHIHISIGQKDSSILRIIQTYFGYGLLNKMATSKTNPNRDIWRYRIVKTELVLDFLKKINPYLIDKKKQSELAIEFLNHQIMLKWKHQSKEEKLYRENIARQIKELKKENIKWE